MPIYCQRCQDEIKSQHDLVVLPGFIKLYAYHTECYGLMMKTRSSFGLGQPVNSSRGTLVPFVILVLYIFFLINTGFSSQPVFHIVWAMLILIPVYQRLFSYYKYEKKL